MLKLIKKTAASSKPEKAIELIRKAHQLSIDASVIFNETGVCILANDAWSRLICEPYKNAEDDNILKRFPEINFNTIFGTQVDSSGRNIRTETYLTINNQTKVPVELSIVQINSREHKLYAATIRDITLRKHREESLIYNSEHDILTGLPNRSHFFRAVNHWIRKTDRSPGGALLMFDLRHFKEINDILGTEVGDKVLAIIGERLQAILGEKHFLARLGGDKFCIFASSDASSIQTITQKLARVTQLEMDVQQIKIQCGFNAGIAIYPNHGNDVRTLFNCADTAMQQAKSSGKDYFIFQAKTHKGGNKRQTLTAQLSDAIDNENLCLLYQPQIEIETGKIRAVEALIRWRHPVYGLLTPVEFLSIAECTHLVRPMTHWAIHRALSDALEWQKEDIHIDVTINLSSVNILDTSFSHSVGTILKQHENAKQLHLEVPESVLTADPRHSKIQLDKFYKMGLPVVMDNFGAGNTSMQLLKSLPLSSLKIDRSFIESMHHSEKNYSLIESMIHLGHSMDLKIVAMGVNSKQQIESLKLMNCEFAQGYYYCQPLPAKDLIHWHEQSPQKIAI